VNSVPIPVQPGNIGTDHQRVGRIACWAYLCGAGALAAAYFIFPGHHLALWSPLGFSASVAVFVGVRLHRPVQKLAWVLLGCAVLTLIIGDTIYNVYVDVLGRDNPFPSVGDLFYLLTYPLIATGLMLLVRSRTARRDRDGLLDALIITTGIGFLSWVFLIEAYVRDDTLSLPQKVVSVAYPLGDVLILAILIRLIVGGGMRLVAVRLLSLGATGILVSDVFYGLIQLHGTWTTNGPVDLGWVVFYLSWGAAALHPSMARIGDAVLAPAVELRRIRLALLAAASLLAPVIVLVQAAHGAVQDAGTAAGFTVVLFLLVLTRLEGVMSVHRELVARERALRVAAAEISAAPDRPQLYTAIVNSALRLLPVTSPSRAELHLGSAGRLNRVAVSGDRSMPLLRAAALIRSPGSDPVQLDRGQGWVRASVTFDTGLHGALALTSGSIPAEVVESLGAIAAQAAVAIESAELSEHVQRQRSEAHFRTLIQNASDVILVADVSGALQYLSPSAERVLGRSIEQMSGRPIQDLLHAADGVRVTEFLHEVAHHRGSNHASTDWRLLHVDGSHRAFEVLFNNLLDDDTVEGIVFTLRDVTERRALQDALTHQAFHDSLTGLANRALFGDRAQQALARQVRTGGTVGVLLVDLDDFKIVNDTRGHAVGDELLVRVAAKIGSVLRPEDTAARLGGDEFAILIEATRIDDIRRAADRLLVELGKPLQVQDEPTQIGSCIGIAVSHSARGGQLDLEELLRRADLALYAGKEQGKNCVVEFHEELHTQMVRRVAARADLQQALEQDQFVVMYQPIVAMDTDTLVAVEALVRWDHPDRGRVMPNEFIPLAEETGLIVPLGAWVLETACAQLTLWRSLYPDIPLRMSVNVSGRQLQEDNFDSVVRDVLQRQVLPAGSLMLEITEGVLLGEDTDVVDALAVIRGLGVKIAIDDFGTGYSSLGYLQRLPIDLLKIDRSFVAGLTTGNSHDGAPARTVVALAQSLNLDLVAEGIETSAQQAELRRLGCPLGQGYLFAPALPVEEVTAVLAGTRGWAKPVDSQPIGVPLQRV
jgi:diguanylate cyclase (GGDEF)-like protein/PAS domain S-box-containing protein